MKVGGPRRAGRAAATKSAGKGAGAKAFSVPAAASASVTETAVPVTTTSSVTAVDALLAIQEVPNESEGRKRAIKRGGDMLDILDDIRMGMLTGSVPKARLNRLLEVVESRRDTFTDPRLSQVLDEIELRARVELAKLTRQAESN